MKGLRRFFSRLTSWATTQRSDERLQAEIEEHLALQASENLRAGLSPVEARRQAALKFGAIEAMKERYREQRGLPSVERLVQDIRYALRRLRMAPGFTAATVLTLALGIGATTSVFTLVHAVLLKSLPVANPGELYRLGKENRCCYLGGYSQDKEFSLVSYDLYKYLRDNTTGFTELAAFPSTQLLFGVRRAGNPEGAQSYPGEFVSGNYFATFGLRPHAGRLLTPADDDPGAPPVAVMSYRLWQQRYGADPSIIGSIFNVNDKPFAVVGITPPGFFGETLRSAPPDFFLPLTTEPLVQTDTDLGKYDTHWLELIGRIQPGAVPASIEAQMRVELKQWLRSHWGEMSAGDRARFPEQTLFLSPGGSGITSLRQQYEQWLLILMARYGIRAADRLRQRRQSHARARHGTAAADFVEHGAGRASVARRKAAAHREPVAFPGRRRRRHCDRVCRYASDSAARVPRDAWIRGHSHRRVAFAAGAAVRFPHVACDRSCLRHCSRLDGRSGPSGRGAPRFRSRHGSRRLAFKKNTRRRPGCALAGVAVGRRDAHGGLAESREPTLRIRAGCAPGGGDESQAWRLPCRAALASVQAHPRFGRRHSRRDFRCSVPLLASARGLGFRCLGRWPAGSGSQAGQFVGVEPGDTRVLRGYWNPYPQGPRHLRAGYGDIAESRRRQRGIRAQVFWRRRSDREALRPEG